jgi:hypothetical protein
MEITATSPRDVTSGTTGMPATSLQLSGLTSHTSCVLLAPDQVIIPHSLMSDGILLLQPELISETPIARVSQFYNKNVTDV